MTALKSLCWRIKPEAEIRCLGIKGFELETDGMLSVPDGHLPLTAQGGHYGQTTKFIDDSQGLNGLF